MYALGIQSFAVSQIKKRQQHVAADFSRARTPGDSKPISTTGDLDIKPAFDLPKVFVELTAQVG
ncbi:MAG: hypothetical protein WBN44_13910 [Woeseiaceae bacterium]